MQLPENPKENPFEAGIMPDKKPEPSPFGWFNRMAKWIRKSTTKHAKPESKKP